MSRLIRPATAPASLLIRAAHTLDPEAGVDGPHDVLIRDGAIAELGAPGTLAAPPGGETVDGTGLHLLPGFFDPHVHLRTPGQEHKEDIETGTRAAAAGGFCAIVAMPNTDPVIDSPPLLRGVQADAERDARVPVGFMPAISRGLVGEALTDMMELRAAGALGFTDDGRPVRSAGLLRRALQYQRLCGGVVHFQHLSAHESVQAVAAAKALGFDVSAEVTPHHLLLTDAAVATLDTRMKMNPPLRTEADRQALIEGLRVGTIDCVATDHAPHAHEDKDVPFEQAAMGTTGLETAFAALYTELVLPGVIGLELLVRRMTAGAALLGLPVARIAPDEPANVCLVDLDASWRVGESGYESRAENCCFAGRMLRGRVLMTVAAGAVAYRERTFALSAA